VLLTKLEFVLAMAVPKLLYRIDNIRNGCRRKEFREFSKPGRVRSYRQDRLEHEDVLQAGSSLKEEDDLLDHAEEGIETGKSRETNP
jgi:hypothetical protein